MKHKNRGTAIAVSMAVAVAAPLDALAEHGSDPGPVKSLGTISVTGSRPTSLPSYIPTTIEGIDRQAGGGDDQRTDARTR